MRACENCAFWEKVGDLGYTGVSYHGECRIKPPVIITTPNGYGETRWPYTDAKGWCGDFTCIPSEMKDFPE